MTQTVQKSQRNLNIDLLKFVYAWMLVFYHFYSETSLHVKQGRMAVEYFLIVAGVFFFMAYERDENAPPQKYIFKRFLRFLPWSTVAFIFTFVLKRMIISPHTAKELVDYLSGDIWEVLLIKMNGLNNGAALLNSPAWTLSTMLLVEIIMLGCLYCNKKVFVHIVLPVTIMMGFGVWRHIDSADVNVWTGYTTFGMIRTWLSYGCAYYCLQITQYLQTVRFNFAGKALLTVIETLCHALAVWVMLNRDSRNWQWCVMLAFVIAVPIAMSGHSLWNDLLHKLSWLIKFLGAYSLSIYLIHRPISRWFEHIYPSTDELYTHVWEYIIAVIVGALVYYFITTGLIRFWRTYGAKIKGIFVES